MIMAPEDRSRGIAQNKVSKTKNLHPTTKMLFKYIIRQLNGAHASAVRSHLKECQHCARTAKALGEESDRVYSSVCGVIKEYCVEVNLHTVNDRSRGTRAETADRSKHLACA